MSRTLTQVFAATRAEGRAALIGYLPAGFPDPVRCVQLITDMVDAGVDIVATVRTADRTGVEMEALTAVSVAALTVVDMTKSLDPAATISDIRVESKTGGRNGDWQR